MSRTTTPEGRITLTVDPIHPKKYLFVVTPVERFFTLNVILNEYETDLFLSLQKKFHTCIEPASESAVLFRV